MRIPGGSRWMTLLAAGACVASCGAQGAAPAVITSCVSKIFGTSRIVVAPRDCEGRYETVVQWNQRGVAGVPGPTGPTGPRGPNGPSGPPGDSALANLHIVLVPASGSAVENGQAFAAVLTKIGSSASSQQPYLIVLDAGSFTLGEKFPAIQPYVSLRGAGMYSTEVEGTLTFSGSVGQAMSFTVSDMTIQGPDVAILAVDAGLVLIENVYTDAFVSLENNFGYGNVMIRNSILTYGAGLNSTTNTTHFTVIGSEVLYFQPPGSAGLLCLSSYNSNFVPYSSSCK